MSEREEAPPRLICWRQHQVTISSSSYSRQKSSICHTCHYFCSCVILLQPQLSVRLLFRCNACRFLQCWGSGLCRDLSMSEVMLRAVLRLQIVVVWNSDSWLDGWMKDVNVKANKPIIWKPECSPAAWGKFLCALLACVLLILLLVVTSVALYFRWNGWTIILSREDCGKGERRVSNVSPLWLILSITCNDLLSKLDWREIRVYIGRVFKTWTLTLSMWTVFGLHWKCDGPILANWDRIEGGWFCANKRIHIITRINF